MTRAERAKVALGFFHERMRENFPTKYALVFDELVSYFDELNPWFLDTFGKALEAATSLSSADLRSAMEHVADVSQGELPNEARHLIVFYDALLSKYDLKTIGTWKRIVSEGTSAAAEDIKTAAGIGLGAAAIYGLAAVAVFALAWGRK